MKSIQFKESVRVKRMTPALIHIIEKLHILQNRYAWIPEVTITSVNDSKHKENSQHYVDLAVDVRTKNFESLGDKLTFIHAVRDELGPSFFVLFEGQGTDNEHLHIQVVRGIEFP